MKISKQRIVLLKLIDKLSQTLSDSPFAFSTKNSENADIMRQRFRRDPWESMLPAYGIERSGSFTDSSTQIYTRIQYATALLKTISNFLRISRKTTHPLLIGSNN
jgi:hypothetical protein